MTLKGAGFDSNGQCGARICVEGCSAVRGGEGTGTMFGVEDRRSNRRTHHYAETGRGHVRRFFSRNLRTT